ncbi:hypothetical protein [Micromonospora wenchangensis]|uniref:hypothetical protein n=1 Tax=Micromonospora wenchangensis TaxID=1185415 RepID=UPI003444E9EA
MLRRVRVNWMNLPAIFGPIGLCAPGPDGCLSYWAGRWRLETRGWRITLNERQDYALATAEARQQRLFILTHAMEISRTDGACFSVDQAAALIEHLRIAFSFAFGYWNSSMLPRGYDNGDRVVWERWYTPICDPHPRIPAAWLYRGRPQDLTELARCALDAFAEPERSSATRLQMQVAVAATERGFVEQRLLTAGPALENLAWTRLVQRPVSSQRTRCGWTEREYKDRRAEERLRYLLEEARVPTNVDPDRFPAVAAFITPGGADGPAVVTCVRNHLVHPTEPDELARHPGLVQETVAAAKPLPRDARVARHRVPRPRSGPSRPNRLGRGRPPGSLACWHSPTPDAAGPKGDPSRTASRTNRKWPAAAATVAVMQTAAAFDVANSSLVQ